MVNNLRTALTRARMTAQEVRTFRGVISSIDRKHQRPKPDRGPGKKGERETT
jgi:tRNA/rRNA methyltransferase